MRKSIKSIQPFLACLLLCGISFFQAIAQEGTIFKYFDSSWETTNKPNAYYVRERVIENGLYKYTTSWVQPESVYEISFYEDSIFKTRAGLNLKYYRNGQTEDSTYYSAGDISNTYHYYPNGKLHVHYTYQNKKETTDAYDENGKRIEDFNYGREADFREGGTAWQTYLQETVKSNVPVKNGAPVGTYQVLVKFIVDKEGKTTDIRAETSHGYGMEEELIRVIKKSPRWNPAIYLNKKVNAYRRQPLTFLVEKN